jgi:hypothetical protein
MHPALEGHIYARWYAEDAVRGAATMLLGYWDDELQIGGFPPPQRAFRYLHVFISLEFKNFSISS